MARYKNELSVIQENKAVFEGIKASIKRFTPDYLDSLGLISRVTIYKYIAKNPINPTNEKLILLSIRAAEELAAMDDNGRMNFAKSLIDETHSIALTA